MQIGKKIFELRNAKMMTQASLAGSEITRNMLCLIEKGKTIPSIPTLIYLAQKLSVPVGYLLCDEKEEFFYKKVMNIENIKELFKNKDYELCRNIIVSNYIDNGIIDDEIAYYLVNSDIELAYENLLNGKLKNSSMLINECVEFAEKTIINVEFILNEACLLNIYLSKISKSLDLLLDEPKYFDYNDMYLYFMYYQFNNKIPFPNEFIDSLYYKYIVAENFFNNKQFYEAEQNLKYILNSNESLPTPFLYQVYVLIEESYRRIGNENEANRYKADKLSIIESMLSDY